MARRTISGQEWQLDADGNPPWAAAIPDPTQPHPSQYVSFLCDGSPFERLLWREIKHIERGTHTDPLAVRRV